MLTKEFHDEAVIDVATLPALAPKIDHSQIEEQAKTVAKPLLFRLLVNGSITDKERVFLDSIAPADCLTFLIHNRTYIHPEGLELFPFDVIESTTCHGGEAVFSHRYEPEHMTDSHQQYRIFSAIINPYESDHIILGFFGPAHRLGRIDDDCVFTRMVYLFRDAYALIKSGIGAAKKRLDTKTATLLIDRSTGRVLSVNRSATKRLGSPDHSLVDISLQQLKYHLSPLMSRYNLMMENTNAGVLDLSVVSLDSNIVRAKKESEVLCSLTGQFTTRAANLGLAADFLKQTACEKGDIETAQLAAGIQRESDALELLTRRLSFMLRFDNLGERTQNLASELDRAIDGVEGYLPTEALIVINDHAVDSHVTAPADAYRMLFEAVLTSHLRRECNDCEMKVTFSNTDSGNLSVVFETTFDSCMPVEVVQSDCSIFIEHLSERLGKVVTRNIAIENEKLVTELTLKHR
ncbi:MAG: hypothetical protein AB1483_12760 [Candidatus Zixiibacteriota bacterium]